MGDGVPRPIRHNVPNLSCRYVYKLLDTNSVGAKPDSPKNAQRAFSWLRHRRGEARLTRKEINTNLYYRTEYPHRKRISPLFGKRSFRYFQLSIALFFHHPQRLAGST